MFSSLGFRRHDEKAHQTQAGLFVVARTKHVNQIGNVMLQTQDPNQVSPEFPSQEPQQRTRCLQGWPTNKYMSTQDEPSIVIPHVKIQMLPQPLREPVPHIHSPLAQIVKEAEAEHVTSPVPEEKQSSSPLQSLILKSRIRGQPNTLQSNKTSPQPPVMVRSEVHSKAQSMARSRLEKARFRLQGRIQQAIKLFGGKEISESQAKRKQVQFQKKYKL